MASARPILTFRGTSASAMEERRNMKVRKDATVTPQDLDAAIRKFIAEGGLITKLPDEKAAGTRMIGRRWNTSELAGESN